MFSRVRCCDASLNKNSFRTDITCNLTRHCGLLPQLESNFLFFSDTQFLLNCCTWLNITSFLPQCTSSNPAFSNHSTAAELSTMFAYSSWNPVQIVYPAFCNEPEMSLFYVLSWNHQTEWFSNKRQSRLA